MNRLVFDFIDPNGVNLFDDSEDGTIERLKEYHKRHAKDSTRSIDIYMYLSGCKGVCEKMVHRIGDINYRLTYVEYYELSESEREKFITSNLVRVKNEDRELVKKELLSYLGKHTLLETI